jgi:hypothetical protein
VVVVSVGEGVDEGLELVDAHGQVVAGVELVVLRPAPRCDKRSIKSRTQSFATSKPVS